jgi:predicted TIM-barrel fold metal-dependent hydrolase
VEIVGIDRVLFSTDYPYQYRPGGGPKTFLDQLPVTQDDRQKIAHGNWDRLIGGIRR